MIGFDPEVPAGFQDADIEMAELEAMGNLIHRLNAKGICTHEGTQRGPDGQRQCSNSECGELFASDDEWWRKRQLVINGYGR